MRPRSRRRWTRCGSGNITQYLKQGCKLQFITPARVDGPRHARGGAAACRCARLRRSRAAVRDLATGLHRAAKEVWPTTGSEAGILDLWVADKGALAEGAGRVPAAGRRAGGRVQGRPGRPDAAR